MVKDDFEELEATPSKKPKPVGERHASEEEGPEDLSYRVSTHKGIDDVGNADEYHRFSRLLWASESANY